MIWPSYNLSSHIAISLESPGTSSGHCVKGLGTTDGPGLDWYNNFRWTPRFSVAFVRTAQAAEDIANTLHRRHTEPIYTEAHPCCTELEHES